MPFIEDPPEPLPDTGSSASASILPTESFPAAPNEKLVNRLVTLAFLDFTEPYSPAEQPMGSLNTVEYGEVSWADSHDYPVWRDSRDPIRFYGDMNPRISYETASLAVTENGAAVPHHIPNESRWHSSGLAAWSEVYNVHFRIGVQLVRAKAQDLVTYQLGGEGDTLNSYDESMKELRWAVWAGFEQETLRLAPHNPSLQVDYQGWNASEAQPTEYYKRVRPGMYTSVPPQYLGTAYAYKGDVGTTLNTLKFTLVTVSERVLERAVQRSSSHGSSDRRSRRRGH